MRRPILRLSAMPAVILMKMGNADINRVYYTVIAYQFYADSTS